MARYTITQAADILGKSSNSIRHIANEQNIDIKRGITDETLTMLQKHITSVECDYIKRGVIESSPDGYVLSSQDVHEITGIPQSKVSSLCRDGYLDGCLTNTKNGPSWFVTEKSVELYMVSNHIPRKRNFTDVLERARFDRFKEHLFQYEPVEQLSRKLGQTKEESIKIAIKYMLNAL